LIDPRTRFGYAAATGMLARRLVNVIVKRFALQGGASPSGWQGEAYFLSFETTA